MNQSRKAIKTPQQQAEIFLVSLNWLEMNATPKSFKCFGTMQKHLWGKFEQYKRNGLIFYHSLDTSNRHIFEDWLAEIGKQFE
jgi:hypothetical protein